MRELAQAAEAPSEASQRAVSTRELVRATKALQEATATCPHVNELEQHR